MCTVLHADEYLKNISDINLHESTVKGCCKEHAHDFVEIGYVVSGEGTHIVAQQPYHIAEGEMFLIGTNVSHEFVLGTAETMTVRNCLFTSEVFGKFEAEIWGQTAGVYSGKSWQKQKSENDLAPCLPKLYARQMTDLLREMYEEYQQKNVGYMQIIQSDLTKVLIQMFRLANSKNPVSNTSGMSKQQIIDRSVDYMQLHYAENITCADLAQQCHMSVSYFNKVFREITGSSVIQMLQAYRMDAAKKLLETTQCTVNEIAYRVGYADMKHFYKVFQRLNDCTPGDYREKLSAYQRH